MNKRLYNYSNLYIVIIVLIITVTPFTFEYADESFVPIDLLILLLILIPFYLLYSRKIQYRFVIALFLLYFLLTIQGFIFGFSFTHIIGLPVTILLAPYLLFRPLKEKVFEYIADAIYFTAILTTIFFIIQIFFPSILEYLMNTFNYLIYEISHRGSRPRYSFALIYTIRETTIEIIPGIIVPRNSGLYHEPGAYAYFLIIAIGINMILKKRLFNKKNNILILILLTTISVSGYVSFLILLLFSAIHESRKKIEKIVLFSLAIFVTIISFNYLFFLREKIEYEYIHGVEVEHIDVDHGGRAFRIRAALNLFSTSPIIGRGIARSSADFRRDSQYFTRGVAAWLVLANYGLLFAPVIFFLYYYGIRKLCILNGYKTLFALYFLIAIFIGGSSQRFFTDNITIQFFMMGLLFQLNK